VRFSLILSTIDRVGEPRRFLETLDMQSCRDFELVVVDQNRDDRIHSLVREFSARFPLVHVKTALRGLSRARNVGIPYAQGEVVAFPDDDCWYEPDLLDRVQRLLCKHRNWHGVTGRGVDDKLEKAPPLQWSSGTARLDRFKLWTMSVSYTIFLRRRVIEKVGNFDERLGVGASTPWGSGEETDYLLRALTAGFEVHYDPSIEVHHPQDVAEYGEKALQRARAYSRGQGMVLGSHGYPIWWLTYRSLRSFGGALLATCFGQAQKAHYHLAVVKGRLVGWAAGRSSLTGE
jgi:glycosyltransferase involved in cell wall biosynthesis